MLWLRVAQIMILLTVEEKVSAVKATTVNTTELHETMLNPTTFNATVLYATTLNIPALNTTTLKASEIKARKEVELRAQLFDNRRKGGKKSKKSASRSSKSTSSESGAAREADDGGLSNKNPTSIEITTEEEKKVITHKDVAASSIERHGWRKWHRKCSKCPDDQYKKWRDPDIRWICGGYQRARRSFKSICMMRYRNCQDGTMFVFIHSNRCKNDSGREERPYGRHFLYDYSVSKMEGDDTSDTGLSKSSRVEHSSDDTSDEE